MIANLPGQPAIGQVGDPRHREDEEADITLRVGHEGRGERDPRQRQQVREPESPATLPLPGGRTSFGHPGLFHKVAPPW